MALKATSCQLKRIKQTIKGIKGKYRQTDRQTDRETEGCNHKVIQQHAIAHWCGYQVGKLC